jgi:hypothetical protein
MAQTTPILDLVILDVHNALNLAVGDTSQYFNTAISSPTLEITPPSYPMISLPFVANSIQVYDSNTLGITTGAGCDLAPLPDGLYKLKYSIYPSYLYYTEKTFLRVDKLMASFDEAWLKLDIFECDGALKYQDRQKLDLIEDYINGAIAAANKCANKLAVQLYNKASTLLTKFVSGNSCCLK